MLRKTQSLGTKAMAQQDKRYDSDSSSDAISMDVPRPPYPRYSPPPTAPMPEKRARIRQAPRPLEQLPPVPPLPTVMPDPLPMLSPPPPSPQTRVKSNRKTILERIEGWWDLGLLEKRQTLFGNSNRQPVPR